MAAFYAGEETYALLLELVATDGGADVRPVPVEVGVEVGVRKGAHRQPRGADVPPDRLTLFIDDGCGKKLMCLAAQRDKLTARLFTVYGAGEHDGRLLPSLLAAAQGDEPLPLTEGFQKRDFTFVGDVADGLIRLAQTPSLAAFGMGSLVNLATGELSTVRSFVEAAAAVLGIEPDRLRFGELPTRGEEMAHEPVNIERLRSVLGWRPPTPIEAGVARTRDFAGRS